MSLQQNINNSIFSLSHLRLMKKQNKGIKDTNISDKKLNKEINQQVNSDQKMQNEVSQSSEKVAIKQKKARKKAKDAIINKQAEYILSQDNNQIKKQNES